MHGFVESAAGTAEIQAYRAADIRLSTNSVDNPFRIRPFPAVESTVAFQGSTAKGAYTAARAGFWWRVKIAISGSSEENSGKLA